MAADYQTGTASSPTNLLTTLVSWLVAQGWTSDASAADGTGWRAHLHKNLLYVNMRAASNEGIWPAVPSGFLDSSTTGYGIGLYLGDGYSGAVGWAAQSGGPNRDDDAARIGAGMNLPSGAIAAYHFFDDGNDHVTVVVEKAPGLFVHMGWGPSLVKTGYTDNFPYFYGSSSYYRVTNTTASLGHLGIDLAAAAPMAHVNYESGPSGSIACAYARVDAATFAGRWISNPSNNGDNNGYTGRFMRCALNQTLFSGAIYNNGLHLTTSGEYPNYEALAITQRRTYQSAFTGALLLPLHCFCHLDPSARWAPIGYPPTVFFCDAVGHGFASTEVYQVGGLDYMVFPNFAVRKAA